MISSRQMWMPLVVMAILGLLSLIAWPTSSTLAQSPPTPTNVLTPTGGDEVDGAEGPPPGPPGALVSGYVYDYSNSARQPGITVVIDGGGWQAETVSDSNGHYQFVNLGSGQGVLNLRLPPGAHPVAPNWPVSFGSGADVRVNLGYYWGDPPPLPVLLSAGLQDSTLMVQVENRTDEAANGGLVDVLLPLDVKASPAVQASQGMVDYSERRVRVALGDLPAGAKATIRVSLEKVESVMRHSRGPGQASPLVQSPVAEIQVMFTYDQQITPQLVALDPEGVSPASMETLMPVTGGAGLVLSLILPILLILVLGVAGWRALRAETG